MELGLTKEFVLLLGIWGLFIGAFLIFLRGSAQEDAVTDRLEPISESQSEKRLYQRKQLPLAVSYAVLEKPDFQGTALSKNISKGGVCLPLPSSLERGSRLRLSIQLPRSRRAMSVWGEVIWQASQLSMPHLKYETGLRFIHLNPSQILTIARSL